MNQINQIVQTAVLALRDLRLTAQERETVTAVTDALVGVIKDLAQQLQDAKQPDSAKPLNTVPMPPT